MMNFLAPSSMFFSFTLLLGLFMTLSANNCLMLWMGLELNLYSFIPIMIFSNSNQEKEAAIKYFLTQALGSGGILLSMLAAQTTMGPPLTFLFPIALALKAGLAPLHFWYPNIMVSLPWTTCLLLSTTQKIAPVSLLLFSFKSNSMLLLFLSMMSAIIGALGGLNQTQMRTILAYSSISHMGWMLAASIYSPLLSTFYFLSYMLLITSVITNIMKIQMKQNDQSTSNMKTPNSLSLSILMLSLGGMPPLFGFLPKLLIISALVSIKMYFLTMILIIGSATNLFYYLKILYSSSLFYAPVMSPTIEMDKASSTNTSFTSTATFSMIIMVLPWTIS